MALVFAGTSINVFAADDSIKEEYDISSYAQKALGRYLAINSVAEDKGSTFGISNAYYVTTDVTYTIWARKFW